jgi:hypothetical protein
MFYCIWHIVKRPKTVAEMMAALLFEEDIERK